MKGKCIGKWLVPSKTLNTSLALSKFASMDNTHIENRVIIMTAGSPEEACIQQDECSETSVLRFWLTFWLCGLCRTKLETVSNLELFTKSTLT